MQTTLLTVGIGCILAAIIGGGLKAFQMEIPLIKSIKRQLLLTGFGVILVLASMGISSGPVESPPTKGTANLATLGPSAPGPVRPNLTYGTWTLHNAIDEAGNDYSKSTLKFTSQQETPDGLKLEGVFTWRIRGGLVGTEEFQGRYVDRNRHILLEGIKTTRASGDLPMTISSYSAILSADERSLGQGRWGGTQQDAAAFNGNWEASR